MENASPVQRAYREWRQAVITAHRTNVPLHGPWREAFSNFLSDMGAPHSGAKLWRHQESRGFTPQNCFWNK